MSKLDDDVAALSGAVTALTVIVGDAIAALGNIVDTSSDEAAVEAATSAIAGLTVSLTAATPVAPTEPPAAS